MNWKVLKWSLLSTFCSFSTSKRKMLQMKKVNGFKAIILFSVFWLILWSWRLIFKFYIITTSQMASNLMLPEKSPLSVLKSKYYLILKSWIPAIFKVLACPYFWFDFADKWTYLKNHSWNYFLLNRYWFKADLFKIFVLWPNVFKNDCFRKRTIFGGDCYWFKKNAMINW